MQNKDNRDIGEKNLGYNILAKGTTLSQKIVTLVTMVVLCALVPASLFTTFKVAKLIYDRVSINAVSINVILCNSNEIIAGLSGKLPGSEADGRNYMLNYVNHVDDSDEASVAIFDMNKNMVVFYNPAGLRNFAKSAKALVDEYAGYKEITYNQNYKIPNKAIGFVEDKENRRLGYVVTGYSGELVNTSTVDSITFLFITTCFGLLIGVLGAIYLARHVKRVLFGLEPEAIATLLQERNVILNSVREGVINVNSKGIVTLINAEAELLLVEANVPNVKQMEQRLASEVFPDVAWKSILREGRALADAPIKMGDTVFMMTVVPIYISQTIGGAVATFRRKSDVFELANQLTGFKNYATALRAQTHEFMNKMHVIMGLIDMGAYDELKKYTKEIANSRQSEVSYVVTRVRDITLAGFILGKIARGRELEIDFSLTEESELSHELEVPSVHDLVLIIGNLVENAFDALKDFEGEKIATLSILDFQHELVIELEDSGPGIAKDELAKIFTRGFSSKGPGHGFGLYLVKNSVDNLDGTISVESVPKESTVFTVRLPIKKAGDVID